MTQTLQIGGFGFRFEGRPQGALDGPFRDFAAEPRPDDRVFQVADLRPSAPTGRPVADAGIWRLYERTARHELAFFAPPGNPVPSLQAILGPDWARGTVAVDAARVPEATRLAPGAGPLGELLLMGALRHAGGLYLHASAALWPDGVDLFLGASGAGKTTISTLAQTAGAQVLSDDRTVLRTERGRLVAYGTPFHGKGRTWAARSGRVRALFFLQHRDENRLTPLARLEACAQLASVAFTQWWERAAIEQTLRAVEQAVASVPVFELGFRPDVSAIQLAADAASRSPNL